jgi:hypothetical protein
VVSSNTNIVAMIIRTGKSQSGSRADPVETVNRGISRMTNALMKRAMIIMGSRDNVKLFHTKVDTKKAIADKIEHPTQPIFRDAMVYTKQNIHIDAKPARFPMAACVAKSDPYCRVRITETGPEVSGKPINQPLTGDLPVKPLR